MLLAITFSSRYNWSSPDLAQIASLKEADTDEFLRRAAHSFNDTFLICVLFEQVKNCSTLLKPVTTDAGMYTN